MSIMSERAEKALINTPQYSTNVIGVIRPGTKLVVNAVKENPGAMAIAAKAFEGSISFIDAEKQISKTYPAIKKAFFPKNPAHFNVHPTDFSGGAAMVKRLLELYGETRAGDTEVKLYRFPVVFPDVGSADAVIPVQFEMHVGMKYHSKENLDGTRNCVFYPKIDPQTIVDQRAKRIKQVGRRELQSRGLCNPEKCAEFANGDCKLKGNLQFYVPGLQGLGVVKMPTGSSYALESIWSQIHNLHKTVGRIPNFDNNFEPVFYLSKKQENRKYFDEKGEEKKGLQWVPVLESRIDSSAILRIQEGQRALLSGTSTGNVEAPVIKVGPAAWQAPMGVAVSTVTLAEVQRSEVIRQNEADAKFHSEPEKTTGMTLNANPATGEIIDAQTSTVSSNVATQAETVVNAEPALTQLLKLAKEFNISNQLEHYATAKYGDAWDSEAIAPQVLTDVQMMYSKLPIDCIPPLMTTFALAMNNKIDVEDVCKPYLKLIFGGPRFFKDPALCKQAQEKMEELLKSGAGVASVFMKQALEKAA